MNLNHSSKSLCFQEIPVELAMAEEVEEVREHRFLSFRGKWLYFSLKQMTL